MSTILKLRPILNSLIRKQTSIRFIQIFIQSKLINPLIACLQSVYAITATILLYPASHSRYMPEVKTVRNNEMEN